MSEANRAPVYFGYSSPINSGNPLEGLRQASAVLETLDLFFASSTDLHAFDQEGNSGMFGLCIILDSCRNAIERAADELHDELNARPRFAPGLPFHALTDKEMRKAWRDGYSHGEQAAKSKGGETDGVD